MDEMEKVLKQLSESNKELTRVLLDIARPVKMSDLPNPFDLHDESETFLDSDDDGSGLPPHLR